jgi:hypothetical protein
MYSVKEKYSFVTASSCYTYFYKSDNIYLMTEQYVSHWIQYNRYEIWKLDLSQRLHIMHINLEKYFLYFLTLQPHPVAVRISEHLQYKQLKDTRQTSAK